MADDWVRNYIQDKINKQKKTEMAAAGAAGIFQRIADRIQEDLKGFYGAGMFQSLTAVSGSGRKFKVSSSDPLPHCTLTIELSVVLLKYNYEFMKDGQATSRAGTLKICSDLEGNLQVYKDGKLFAVESDVSDVSEFLLRPLLNHIDE
jgi:hypothetical protein